MKTTPRDEQAKTRSFVGLGSDERPRRPAPMPMRSPARSLVRFVLSRRPQVWVSQSMPEGRARAKARATCQKGSRILKPA